LSPEIVEKFRIAIERALQKTVDQQAAERADVQKKLSDGFSKESPPKSDPEPKKGADEKVREAVEGYKMEEVQSKDKDSHLPSSGAQWYAILFAAMVIGLVAVGMRLRNRREKRKCGVFPHRR
jgi:cobaltochelatase CobN